MCTRSWPVTNLHGFHTFVFAARNLEISCKLVLGEKKNTIVAITITITIIIEGSLEVKLPTIWTDEKQSRAEAERRGRLAERRSEEKE